GGGEPLGVPGLTVGRGAARRGRGGGLGRGPWRGRRRAGGDGLAGAGGDGGVFRCPLGRGGRGGRGRGGTSRVSTLGAGRPWPSGSTAGGAAPGTAAPSTLAGVPRSGAKAHRHTAFCTSCQSRLPGKTCPYSPAARECP